MSERLQPDLPGDRDDRHGVEMRRTLQGDDQSLEHPLRLHPERRGGGHAIPGRLGV